eukprot:COSAG01_NODE_4577_length_4906_cov_91.659455_3_plen_141_part_00
MSGPREPLTPRQDGGGAPSPLCHQLPGLASFTIRTVALAAAVPQHPSWKGWIRASAKASSSSLGRVARRLLILLFYASADSLQNRMEKAYIRLCRQNYSLCYTLIVPWYGTTPPDRPMPMDSLWEVKNCSVGSGHLCLLR